jgi:hypothetical protein
MERLQYAATLRKEKENAFSSGGNWNAKITASAIKK